MQRYGARKRLYMASAATHTGTIAFSGAGSLAVAGVRTRYGTIAFVGSGSFAQAGTRTRFGTVAFSGTGSLSVTGTRTTFGAQTFSGTGSFALSGVDMAGTGTTLTPGSGAKYFSGPTGPDGRPIDRIITLDDEELLLLV